MLFRSESNGDVTFPSTAKVVNGGNNLNFQPGNGGVTQIFSDDGSNVWSFQNYNQLELPENGNIYSYSNLRLVVGSPAWAFDGNANLTLPIGGNIYYGNGDLYGGGGNTFSNITMTDGPAGASDIIKYGLGNLVVWNEDRKSTRLNSSH